MAKQLCLHCMYVSKLNFPMRRKYCFVSDKLNCACIDTFSELDCCTKLYLVYFLALISVS
jgi:hypothetical protein